jgi:hypothetical protein
MVAQMRRVGLNAMLRNYGVAGSSKAETARYGVRHEPDAEDSK